MNERERIFFHDGEIAERLRWQGSAEREARLRHVIEQMQAALMLHANENNKVVAAALTAAEEALR